MRSPFHILALLVCLALWGCGGSGGGSSSNSSSGGGGDSTIPISAATYADRLVLVTSSSDISLYGLSDGGGAENLSATEVSASWSVASNLITINESRPDINGDGMLDSYRFTGAAVGSVNTLNGQHLINISPSESYTPAARAFRLPTVNSVGALSTALTWEADDGFRYTFSTNSGEGTITATTRPGFMSGTVLVTGGWIYLRATYFDSGMTKRVHLIAVRDTTDGTVLHGVQAIDNSGLTPTVDESATLVAVPGGAG